MTQPSVELVVDARCGTGESPVWSIEEQALYWVDIPGRALHRWSAGGHARWATAEMPACIAPRAGRPGEWLAGMESGLFALSGFDAAGGTPLQADRVAGVTHARTGMRFNDGRCDRQGRFWA
ncbi:MAG: gluconolactonase, partial [Variovorax paradoxus]